MNKLMTTGVILLLTMGIMGFTTRITQNFGLQKDGDFHHGVDIAVDAGKMIINKIPGTVLKAEYSNVYGLFVLIDHGDIQTLYGHNSKLLVKAGDKVNVNQPIALTGSSGDTSTGNHIHFELRRTKDGKAINPYDYLNGQK